MFYGMRVALTMAAPLLAIRPAAAAAALPATNTALNPTAAPPAAADELRARALRPGEIPQNLQHAYELHSEAPSSLSAPSGCSRPTPEVRPASVHSEARGQPPGPVFTVWGSVILAPDERASRPAPYLLYGASRPAPYLLYGAP